MIKSINRNNISTTPFVAIKSWTIMNVHSEDLVLIEESASVSYIPYSASAVSPEIPVAYEYVDYYDGSGLPFVNRECSIALEQQSASLMRFDQGENITGTFYPTEATSSAGNYKRLVYQEIKNMFYNDFKDPTKIWGLENIDFPKSNTKKFLSDKFTLFAISKNQYGEKMIPGSVILVDNSLDDNYLIQDDKNGNLIAKGNLFSRIQEVRRFTNVFITGSNGISLVTGSSYNYAQSSGECNPW
jgi:hypothetical protein